MPRCCLVWRCWRTPLWMAKWCYCFSHDQDSWPESCTWAASWTGKLSWRGEKKLPAQGQRSSDRCSSSYKYEEVQVFVLKSMTRWEVAGVIFGYWAGCFVYHKIKGVVAIRGCFHVGEIHFDTVGFGWQLHLTPNCYVWTEFALLFEVGGARTLAGQN